MIFEIRVLLRNEDTFSVTSKSLIEIDQMIPILGNRFDEVAALTIIAKPDTFSGSKEFILHQQRFV